MKRTLALLACMISLLSLASVADSIAPDPKGILQPGTYYWVAPFDITSANIPTFNPFTASFCEQNETRTIFGITYTGPECVFVNDFQPITNLLLTFPGQNGTIGCINLVANSTGANENCVNSPNSILFLLDPINVDSHFNILFGATDSDTWANVPGYGLNPLPEPGSAALLLGGFGTLFGVLRRKAHPGGE